MSPLRQALAAVLTASAAWAAGATAPGMERYEGLEGRALADAVRADYAPAVGPPSSLPVGGFEPDDWPSGWMPGRWIGSADRISLIVPPAWTGGEGLHDLYNLIGAEIAFDLARNATGSQAYAPGEVADVAAQGPGWKAGFALYGGTRIGAWEPDDDRKGDLARRMMYVGLMYPRPQWADQAFFIFDDGPWPLLRSRGVELLGKWSAADPVDERELAETAATAAAQGNENPFVAMPELFDYLWGEKAGQAVVPPAKRERIPIKAIYSIEADRELDLYSPYAPDDARWSVDGDATAADSVDLEQIGVGRHTVAFEGAGRRGKIIITVVP